MDLGPSMPSWQLPQVALSSSLSPIFRFGWLDLVDDGEFSLQVGKALYFATEIPKFWYWSPAFLTLFAHFTCKLNQLKPSYIILNHLESRFCWWFPHFGDRFRPLTGTTTLLRPGMESRAAAGGLDVAIALAQPGVPGEKIGKTGKMRSMENENGGLSTRNGGFIWFYMGKSWEY